MLYQKPPRGFSPRLDAVGCFLQYRDTLLLLLRCDNAPQGGKWGMPAGKVEKGEEKHTAMLRELEEETGLVVGRDSVSHFGTVYVKWPEYDFTYHMFGHNLKDMPIIHLRPAEHSDYRWVKPVDAFDLDLVDDLDECIRMVYHV